MVAGLAEFMSHYRLTLLGHHLFGPGSVAGHREILDAVRARDGEAAEERVRAHIRAAIDLIGRL